MEVLIGGVSYVNTTACGRETRAIGESIAQRSQRHRGNGGLDRGGSFRERRWLPCEKKAETLFYRRFPDRILWGPNPKSPLRDLCGLCAMLSLWRLFLRPEATVLPIEFSGPQSKIPPL